MKRTEHAREIASRFQEMMQQAGDSISDEHINELALLIEAGIDTVMVESLEAIANKLDDISHQVRHDAEFFQS